MENRLRKFNVLNYQNCKTLLNDFITIIGDEILRYCIAPVDTSSYWLSCLVSCYILRYVTLGVTDSLVRILRFRRRFREHYILILFTSELIHSYDGLGIDWGLFIYPIVTFRKSWVTTYDSEHMFLFGRQWWITLITMEILGQLNIDISISQLVLL